MPAAQPVALGARRSRRPCRSVSACLARPAPAAAATTSSSRLNEGAASPPSFRVRLHGGLSGLPLIKEPPYDVPVRGTCMHVLQLDCSEQQYVSEQMDKGPFSRPSGRYE